MPCRSEPWVVIVAKCSCAAKRGIGTGPIQAMVPQGALLTPVSGALWRDVGAAPTPAETQAQGEVTFTHQVVFSYLQQC